MVPPLAPGERVFLTGGTGLVGSHLAALLRREGHPVTVFHRPGGELSFLRGIGCDLLEGSLRGGCELLGSAMEGCGAVVHCAAMIYADLPWARVRAVNVEGTREVFERASGAGVRRGVYLSSVTVYGDPSGPIDEESPIDTPLRPVERYARSKREGERAVREVVEGSRMAVAILRPSAIYGERDRLFTPRLLRILRLPLHFLLGSGRTPLPVVYAGNLAAAIVAALRGPLSTGTRAYNVASDDPVTQRDFLHGLADVLEISFRPVSIPRGIVLTGARLGEALGARIPDAGELSLRRAAWLAVHPNPFRSQRIREELGWSPAIPKAVAIRDTARWFRDLQTNLAVGTQGGRA